jgi:recombination protein RecR
MIGPLDALITALKRLPGVGEKTATRYAFHILNADPDSVRELMRAIKDVREKLRLCSICFHLTDTDPCSLCSNPRRDTTRICVVETPLDLIAVEKSGAFKGVYHVLHGLLSPLEAIGPGSLRLDELWDRIERQNVTELILALNPTVEGEATAAYIKTHLKRASVVVTRIAYGIPLGGSLELTDPLTLSRALENRRQL